MIKKQKTSKAAKAPHKVSKRKRSAEPAQLRGWALYTTDKGTVYQLGTLAAYGERAALEWAAKRAKQQKLSTRAVEAIEIPQP